MCHAKIRIASDAERSTLVAIDPRELRDMSTGSANPLIAMGSVEK